MTDTATETMGGPIFIEHDPSTCGCCLNLRDGGCEEQTFAWPCLFGHHDSCDLAFNYCECGCHNPEAKRLP